MDFKLSEKQVRKILKKKPSDQISETEIKALERHYIEVASFLYDRYVDNKSATQYTSVVE